MAPVVEVKVRDEGQEAVVTVELVERRRLTARLRARYDLSTEAVGDPLSVELEMPGGVKPTDVHRFAWSKWLAVAHARAVMHGSRQGSDETGTEVVARRRREHHALEEAVAHALGAEPPIGPADAEGRPWSSTHGAAFYRRLAEQYLRLRAEGETAPVEAIARVEGHNRNTVAGWVRKARQLGYLPPARPGRPG